MKFLNALIFAYMLIAIGINRRLLIKLVFIVDYKL